VVLVTADDSDSRSLVALGAHLEPIVFKRGGISVINDFLTYRRLKYIFKKWQPVLIQQFHAKPVVLGSLAARNVLGESVRIVNTITGLGYAFFIGGITSLLAGLGYSFAIQKSDIVIFQNRDDRNLFFNKKWVTNRQAREIISSGVDTNKFKFIDRANTNFDSPKVIILARLLKQKGILEFAEVAHRISEQIPRASFIIAGEEEPNHPDGLTLEMLSQLKAVTYLGHLKDIQPILAEAALFLFPSYYREGVPRVILEASSTGLPTVAFDEPGIREAVQDKITGFLVKNRNLDELTEKTFELLENHEKRLLMGLSARQMVEEQFGIKMIQKQYLDIYRDLGVKI
jgi:glycosyltransferase involved in cell wall biosynthesis